MYELRTNIMIDDALMSKAMDVSGLKTKKEIVEKALEEFIEKRTRKDLSELKGRIQFYEGYDHNAFREGSSK